MMPDAILLVGDDGISAGANAGAENMRGYVRDMMMGQPVEILVPDLPDGRCSILSRPPARTTDGAINQVCSPGTKKTACKAD